MMNDPTDQRVVGAQAFVDSLAVKSPNSEVGVVAYDQTATAHNPIPLNSAANIQKVKAWINEASCVFTGFNNPRTTIRRDTTDTTTPAPGGLGKTSAIKATYLGIGLQNGMAVVDNNFSSIPSNMKRHIILLTDGAWDDMDVRSPDLVVSNYTTQNSGRALPVIHGVFLSNQTLHTTHQYPSEGCSNADPVILGNLEHAATLGSEKGLYFNGSTPQTVVKNFDTLLNRMTERVSQQLTGMIVTNTTTGEVRTHKTLSTVDTSVTDTISYTSTLDNLPLIMGLNLLKVQRIVKKPGTAILDTLTSTVSIYRVEDWTTQVNPKEVEIFCNDDSTTISITVTPPMTPLNNPFTVNATIAMKDKLILDPIQVRVFTQFPDIDANTKAVFHMEYDLNNAADPTEKVTIISQPNYNKIDTLFGQYVLSQGSFKTNSIGTISGDFAFEAWIRPSNLGSQTDIFSGTGYSFGIGADRVLYFTAGAETVKSTVAVDANIWSHVAISRASGAVRIYLNGIDVSKPVQFAGTLQGAVTITCPGGGVLDEVRISTHSRLRADPNYFRLDIPSLQNPAWTINGTSVAQPMAVITPGMWNNGNIQFQFASPVPGKLVVNFQYMGPVETRWSKNGNPVFAAGDLQGPFVTWATFTTGQIASSYDTLGVRFSEKVRCDSLKKDTLPINSFQVFGPGHVLKPSIFEGAYYLDGKNCPGIWIDSVTIVVKTRVDGIVPLEDSILLVAYATVDTAGNYPDTTRLGTINYGPGRGIQIVPLQSSGNVSPMILAQGLKDRTGITEEMGKIIVIQTRDELLPIPGQEGKPKDSLNYGKTILYDAVANVVRSNLEIRKFKTSNRMYYVLWDGTNRNKRRVASGAYVLKALVNYKNEVEAGVQPPPLMTKFSIKWSSGK